MTEKLDGLTMDIESENKARLRAVFPECFTEGRLDIDKLLSLCGEYITDDFEKYEFKWKGKSQCLRLAQKRSTATLRPCPEESVNFDSTQNLYIEGDNLEVLKLLQKSYYRRVKLIYIDPPYNTGKDFVYEDDFADPLARYKEVTQQTTKSNPETMGRYHTNWLNMMYPRLRLAANLLRDDGVIFISIDDGEIDNLRKICNETFGEENFVVCIANVNNPKGRSDEKNVATAHEYILVYQKMGVELLGFAPENKVVKRYNKVDELGRYRNIDLRKTGDSDRRIDRPNMFYYFMYNPKTEIWYPTFNESTPEGYIKIAPMKDDGTDGRWRVGIETAIERREFLQPYYMVKKSRWTVVEKDYYSNEIKIKATTAWTFKDVNSERGTEQFVALGFDKNVFPRPKPLGTIKRIIQLAVGNDSDDIIMDFFSGSATTAQAIMQLNYEDGGKRRYIMVQLPAACDEKGDAFKAGFSNLCEIGKERIRRAGKQILDADDGQTTLDGDKPVVDVGFKVFKLDSSNLKVWDDTPIPDGDVEALMGRLADHIDGLKHDRSEIDFVYEILLKMGYPLTADITAYDADGIIVYSVDENSMLICLHPGVTAELIERLAELVPQKIVVTENCFANNSDMSNAHYLLENRNIELKII